jgi:hypothetical protein
MAGLAPLRGATFRGPFDPVTLRIAWPFGKACVTGAMAILPVVAGALPAKTDSEQARQRLDRAGGEDL